VDAPAEIDQGAAEGTMAEVEGHYVTPSLVEGEQSRGLAPGRCALAQLPQQASFDQLANEAGDSGAGETGLTGDLGAAGGALVGDQFEGGAEVAATGIVTGRLGVTTLLIALGHLPPPKKVK
jgi:hypothetical protein